MVEATVAEDMVALVTVILGEGVHTGDTKHG